MNLPEDEIHIWQVGLSDVDPAALTQQALAWLQAKEIVRYERLAQQRNRLEFLLGKWLTRICLSKYTGLAWAGSSPITPMESLSRRRGRASPLL